MGKLSIFLFASSAFLAAFATDCSKRLDIGSLYIGGCSLERHAKNITDAQNSERSW